jgi:hypothetical protein
VRGACEARAGAGRQGCRAPAWASAVPPPMDRGHQLPHLACGEGESPAAWPGICVRVSGPAAGSSGSGRATRPRSKPLEYQGEALPFLQAEGAERQHRVRPAATAPDWRHGIRPGGPTVRSSTPLALAGGSSRSRYQPGERSQPRWRTSPVALRGGAGGGERLDGGADRPRLRRARRRGRVARDFDQQRDRAAQVEAAAPRLARRRRAARCRRGAPAPGRSGRGAGRWWRAVRRHPGRRASAATR